MSPRTSSWIGTLAFCLAPVVILATLAGCWPFSPAVVIKPPDLTPPGSSQTAKPEGPKTVEQCEKELAEAKAELVKAKQLVQQKDKALDDARLSARQKKLRWAAGICLAGLLACIAGAVFLPGALRWFVSGGIASILMGLTCLLVSAILPYLPWILAGLGLVGGAVGIYLWRRDHAGLRKVVSAVNAVKEEIPDYKTKLKKYVNGSTDKYVNKVREKLGLKKKKE